MRFPGKWPTKNDLPADRSRERQLTTDFIRNRGTLRKPEPPRDLIAQSGPRGILVTWALPATYFDVVGWRIYKNDENTLYHELRDRGTRQIFVESTAATVSPTINIFISSLNALGTESPKVQVQSAALSEPNAPGMPGVPPGYNDGGGMNKNNYYGKGGNPN